MPIIEIKQVTKEFQLGQLVSLKTVILNLARRLRGRPVERRSVFRALDDVCLEIEQGEVVGIIGHNGAGKSTLLKILAGITTPTTGCVEVHGRIAPLIEVGAGFVPDLTGRENVYLNGSILGLSRKAIDAKFEEIVNFAEMAEFIDTPVKRYSSGMKVKLAFSVATSIESEILVVDEVLAVGDLAFQRKCFDRMEDLIKRSGRTVLLVSHNIRQVERLCGRVILLSHGTVVADGSPADTCRQFYRISNEQIKRNVEQSQVERMSVTSSGEVEVQAIQLVMPDGGLTEEITSGDPLHIRLLLDVRQHLRRPEIVVGTHTTDFVYLTANSTAVLDERPDLPVGVHEVDCYLPNYPLAPGVYCVRLAVFDEFRRKVFSGETLKVFAVNPAESEGKEAALRLLDVEAQWAFEGGVVGQYGTDSRQRESAA